MLSATWRDLTWLSRAVAGGAITAATISPADKSLSVVIEFLQDFTSQRCWLPNGDAAGNNRTNAISVHAASRPRELGTSTIVFTAARPTHHRVLNRDFRFMAECGCLQTTRSRDAFRYQSALCGLVELSQIRTSELRRLQETSLRCFRSPALPAPRCCQFGARFASGMPFCNRARLRAAEQLGIDRGCADEGAHLLCARIFDRHQGLEPDMHQIASKAGLKPKVGCGTDALLSDRADRLEVLQLLRSNCHAPRFLRTRFGQDTAELHHLRCGMSWM